MSTYYIASNLERSYYISHHGILGQKWGVRRYQNQDGSLTSAGKVHSREKRVGTGTATVGKGRKIETAGPVSGPKINRPKWIDPNVGAYSGNWQNAAKHIRNNKRYSKLADWFGKDELDNLRLANQLQQIAEHNAYAAAYNDQQLDILYEELQQAIDEYEEDPSDANHKKYDQLLNAYMTQVESHKEHNQMVLDAQAYVRKCEAECANTPLFKCYALAEAGKRAAKAKLGSFVRTSVKYVKNLLS